jgi:hypothetical protein
VMPVRLLEEDAGSIIPGRGQLEPRSRSKQDADLMLQIARIVTHDPSVVWRRSA